MGICKGSQPSSEKESNIDPLGFKSIIFHGEVGEIVLVVHNGLKTDLSNKHCHGGHEQNHIDLAGRGLGYEEATLKMLKRMRISEMPASAQPVNASA